MVMVMDSVTVSLSVRQKGGLGKKNRNIMGGIGGLKFEV
jgi:hypothetical protein